MNYYSRGSGPYQFETVHNSYPKMNVKYIAVLRLTVTVESLIMSTTHTLK